MRTIYGFLLLAVTSIAVAQTTRVEEYCEDLRHANRYSSEWRDRCIANLKVQEKYQKKAQDAANDAALNAKTEWILALADLIIAHKKATSSEEKLTIVTKVEMLCARTGTSCDGYLNTSEWTQIKNTR